MSDLRAALAAAHAAAPSASRQEVLAALAAFLRALPEWTVAEGMPSQESAKRLALALTRTEAGPPIPAGQRGSVVEAARRYGRRL